jgi:transposase InsO family protein
VADLTYLRCWEGVGFFAFIIDAFSRRIVGWQLAGHMRTTLVLDALKMALHQRGPGADVELVHHSDRGSQADSRGRCNASTVRSCDGRVEAASIRSGGAGADAFAWSSRGGAA